MATVNIQKRTRKKYISYQVYYKDPSTGEKKYHNSYRKQKEAQQVANDLRALLDTGKLPDNKIKKLRVMTFNAVGKELVTEWSSKIATGKLAARTVVDYITILNTVSKPFGNKFLSEITTQEVECYCNQVAAELSNISSNRRLFVIKQVFKIGLKLHAIRENQVKGIQKLSEKKHERNRFLLPHEITKLVKAAKETKAKYYLPALIFLGVEHGASKQEALSLKWSDIIFEYEGIGMINFYRTKNSKERTDYLMPQTKLALLEWKEHQKFMRKRKNIDTNGSNLVFSHLNGTPIKNFNRAWWAALEKAGIENLHFHDLRHCFCSNLILAGAGLKEVKEMIGHSDIAMTDRYSHLIMKHKHLQQQRLAEHYAQQTA